MRCGVCLHVQYPVVEHVPWGRLEAEHVFDVPEWVKEALHEVSLALGKEAVDGAALHGVAVEVGKL